VGQLLAQPLSGQKKWRADGQGQFDCQHRLGFLPAVNVHVFGKQFDSVAVQHGISFGFDRYRRQKSKLSEKIQQIFVHFKGLNGKKTAKFVV